MRTNLEVLRRRWWIIAATTLVALATSWALTSRAERVYQGTVTLRVSTPTSSGATVRGDDVTYTDRLVNTYTQILNSRPLRDDVRRQAGLAERPSLGVTVPANTELMRITATERDGRAAAAAANASFDALKAKVRQLAAEDQQAATQIFGARVRELEASLIPVRKEYAAATAAAANEYSERARAAADEIRRLQETLARVRADFDAARLAAQRRADTISLIEPASVPGSPSSPNVPRNLAAGLLFGLIGGLGLAFLLDRADTRLRSSHQIAEAAVATVLGQIPGSARVASSVAGRCGRSSSTPSHPSERPSGGCARTSWPSSVTSRSARSS
jgi:capsular polysaccharide biosynthesis protein